MTTSSTRKFVYGIINSQQPAIYDPYWHFPHEPGKHFRVEALRSLRADILTGGEVADAAEITFRREAKTASGTDTAEMKSAVYRITDVHREMDISQYSPIPGSTVSLAGRTRQLSNGSDGVPLSIDLTSLDRGVYHFISRVTGVNRVLRRRFGFVVQRAGYWQYQKQTSNIKPAGIFVPAGAIGGWPELLGEPIDIFAEDERTAERVRARFRGLAKDAYFQSSHKDLLKKWGHGLVSPHKEPESILEANFPVYVLPGTSTTDRNLEKAKKSALSAIRNMTVKRAISLFSQQVAKRAGFLPRLFESKPLNDGVVFIGYVWEVAYFRWDGHSYVKDAGDWAIVKLVHWSTADLSYRKARWQLVRVDNLAEDLNLTQDSGHKMSEHSEPPNQENPDDDIHSYRGLGLALPKSIQVYRTSYLMDKKGDISTVMP
jgi:hypothetical protein